MEHRTFLKTSLAELITTNAEMDTSSIFSMLILTALEEFAYC